MSGFVNTFLLALLLLQSRAIANQTGIIESKHASEDVKLQLDPSIPFWKMSAPIYLELNSFGKPVPGYRTEVRTHWTRTNLYLLFICPYDELHLKPQPNSQQ